jgi:hypothetical protein
LIDSGVVEQSVISHPLFPGAIERTYYRRLHISVISLREENLLTLISNPNIPPLHASFLNSPPSFSLGPVVLSRINMQYTSLQSSRTEINSFLARLFNSSGSISDISSTSSKVMILEWELTPIQLLGLISRRLA